MVAKVKYVPTALSETRLKRKAAIEMLIEVAGGRRNLADVLGIRVGTLNGMIGSTHIIPQRHLLTIKTVYGIPPEVIRPDLFIIREA